MTRKKRFQAAPLEVRPDGEWIRHQEYTVNGREISQGAEITIKGLGRCYFHEYVQTPLGDHITVMRKGKYRSVSTDRTVVVHRKKKLR